MARAPYDTERPARTIAELRQLAGDGASPAELLEAAGIAPDDVPAVLAAIAEAAALAAQDPAGVPHLLVRLWLGMAHEERLEARLRSGEPGADWGVAQLAGDFTECERADALSRIMDRMRGPPVHPRRFPALNAAARSRDTTVQAEVERLAWTALQAAAGPRTPAQTFQDDAGTLKAFRSELQRAVCAELLPGYDWHRGRDREAPLEEDAAGAAHDREAELDDAREALEELVRRADLTAGELKVLELDLQDVPTPDIASRLDTSPGAVRRRRADTLKKLREAARPGAPE